MLSNMMGTSAMFCIIASLTKRVTLVTDSVLTLLE